MNEKILNDKQKVELAFWKNEFDRLGEDGFLELRKNDYIEKTKHFKEYLEKEAGEGLDVGSGLFSIFEFAPLDRVKITAIDPLMDEYTWIFSYRDKVLHYQNDGEALGFNDNFFDFVVNINCLDHTPNPQKMVDEMYRVLKTNGKLYLQINFDHPESFSPAHYSLFTKQNIDNIMDINKWSLEKEVIEKNQNYPQDLYNSIWTKK